MFWALAAKARTAIIMMKAYRFVIAHKIFSYDMLVYLMLLDFVW